MTSNIKEYSSVDDIKKDIETINNFSIEFYNKQSVVIARINDLVKKLDNIIADEEKNSAYLNSLSSKVQQSELENSMKALLQYKNIIDAKNKEYLNVINNNKKMIYDISSTLKNNDAMLQNIRNVLKELEEKSQDLANKIG